MVLPIILAAGGIAVASGIVQYMNSEKARKATAEERARLRQLLENIKDPNFDYSSIDPATYAVVEKYVPQSAAVIQERAPTLVKGDSADAKLGLDVQREALQRFREQAVAGRDVQSEIDTERNLRRMNQNNQGQLGAIEQSFARRGQGGSGLEFLSQLNAQQNSAENAQSAGEQSVLDAQRRRLEAMRGATDLGTNMRQSAISMETGNAGIMNSFNARTAANAQNVANMNVQSINQGSQFNINNSQDVSNRNATAKYANDQRTQDRDTKLQQQVFDNNMSRATGQVQQGNQAIGDINQNAADKNKAVAGVASGVTTAIAPTPTAPTAPGAPAAKLTEDDPNDPLNRRY